MSYILDALKKSQQQHQKQKALENGLSLSLESAPTQTAQRSSHTLIWVALWLVCGLGVLLYVLGVRQGNQSSALTDTAFSETSSFIENNDARTASALAKAEPQAPQNISLPGAQGTQGTAWPVPQNNTIAIAQAESTVGHDGAKDAPPPQAKGSVQTRTLPPLSVLQKVPAISVQAHIYSSVSDKRRVTLNNKIWREGEWLSDAVLLKEITQNGVLLEVDGWDLPVHRQQGWTPL